MQRLASRSPVCQPCGPIAVLILISLATALGATAEETATHDRAFWRTIARNNYATPAGQDEFALAGELSGYLAESDPELRDDLAYSILYTWIVRQGRFTVPQLQSLAGEWQRNLQVGIGESGTDKVFVRSFSALCLAALAERDAKTPFLDEQRYRSLLRSTLDYLSEERDLRGFDPVKGWIHATAHTADLLSALAQSKFLQREQQDQILHGITERLWSAKEIFSYGEQDRLALVAATIVRRQDFDEARFREWLANLDRTDERVWKQSPPEISLLRGFENDSYFLRALAVHLQLKSPAPAVADARDAVILLLRKR